MKKFLFVATVLLLMGLSSSMFAQEILSGKFKAKDGDAGYSLHENEGSRMHSIEVIFEKPFSTRPDVVISTTKLDASAGTNVRYELSASAVSRDGFVLKMNTWGDSKIYQIEGNWIAFVSSSDEE